MLDLSVIILTYNEELHIERCIQNVRNLAKDIYVIDSFSTDRTVEIAESLGAKVLQNKWPGNQAIQFNWGLQNLPITTRWVLRLDADEYLTQELIQELQHKLPTVPTTVSGIVLPREQNCMGTWVHPIKLLRIFEYGKGECEQKWMDEHILLTSGDTIEMTNKFLDHNLNSFGWWIDKHNNYSIREAVDLLDLEFQLFNKTNQLHNIGEDALAKRAKKLKYARSPLFWRSFAYFMYRYFFKLGFTKGKSQFIWDFFQGFWYRTLVDAKIYEIKRFAKGDPEKMKWYIEHQYRLKLDV